MQRFAMQSEIEAFAFLIGRDTQAAQEINDFQRAPCADHAPENGDDDAHGLNAKLCGIAFQEARNPVWRFGRDTEGGSGKDACQQSAEQTAHAMHAEHVERVVIFQALFDDGAKDIAHTARQGADHQSMPRQHIA